VESIAEPIAEPIAESIAEPIAESIAELPSILRLVRNGLEGPEIPRV